MELQVKAVLEAQRLELVLAQFSRKPALDLVAEAAGCVVVQAAGNVLKVEKPPRVYFAFENADVQTGRIMVYTDSSAYGYGRA
ncbi:MAG: hypothetical protein ACWGMY_09030, partial [Hyphomicrobiaceae bacterium]